MKKKREKHRMQQFSLKFSSRAKISALLSSSWISSSILLQKKIIIMQYIHYITKITWFNFGILNSLSFFNYLSVLSWCFFLTYSTMQHIQGDLHEGIPHPRFYIFFCDTPHPRLPSPRKNQICLDSPLLNAFIFEGVLYIAKCVKY